MSDHECQPGSNPRAQGSCVRCGKVLPRDAMKQSFDHDLCDEAFEIQATIVAARQAGVDGRALDAFARARKIPGPVKQHATRDFHQEVAEELADARNYLVWWMEQQRAAGTLSNEKQWNLMQALGAVAVAWHHMESS